MQKRDQSRAAFIDEVEFLLDPGADLACRTRQCCAYPRLQIVFNAWRSDSWRSRPHRSQAFDPALFEKLAPAADRVVVEQKRLGGLLTAPPFVQKHQGVRTPRHPSRRGPVARQRDQRLAIFFAEETRLNRATESARSENARNFFPLFNESGYTYKVNSIVIPKNHWDIRRMPKSGMVREIAADLQTGDRMQESQESKVYSHSRRIAVIGLGYVGLPVAVSFARPGLPVIGFDIWRERIAELEAHHDRTRELDPDTLRDAAVRYTDDLEVLLRGRLFHRHRANSH